MINKLVKRLFEEKLFLIILFFLLVSSIILKRIPQYNFADVEVVYTLFVFLIIINGLSKSGLFDEIAINLGNKRFINQKLLIFTALLSIFITNDVALLTIIPITLILIKENIEEMIILETMMANTFSSLTPFGNPQNIFIYYFYHLHPIEFIKSIFPFSLTFFILIIIFSSRLKNHKYENQTLAKTRDKKGILYLLFFILFILAILRLIPLETGILIILYVILFDRKKLKIDYFLLLTFIVFFGFTDNLMHAFKFSLNSSNQVFFYSLLGSQVISNVPSALLFADFSSNWKALLWGVSAGGLGTIIGSLASLIAYRLYYEKHKKYKSYLIKFHIFNISALILSIILFLIIF